MDEYKNNTVFPLEKQALMNHAQWKMIKKTNWPQAKKLLMKDLLKWQEEP